MTTSKLGIELRKARLRRGVTLKALAAKLRISIPYLSDLERGRRRITYKRLMQVAKALELREPETNALLQIAQCLPPSVSKELLSVPFSWSWELAALLETLQVAASDGWLPETLRKHMRSTKGQHSVTTR